MSENRVAKTLLLEFPQLVEAAMKLDALVERFERLELPPVVFGDRTARGLSWRCQALARANLLRGQELFFSAIRAMNEGSILTTFVLTRTLYETVAFVVFARLKVEKAISKNDPEGLRICLMRLLSGNSIQAKTDAHWPKPYHINDVLRDAGAYLHEFLPEEWRARPPALSIDYDWKSEFVHPNQGSFALYQRVNSTGYEFTREVARKPEVFSHIVSALSMNAHFLLQESESLASLEDLPESWPSPKAR